VRRDAAGNLIYPVSGRDTAKSGIGCRGNRRLSDLVAVQFRERGRLKTEWQDESGSVRGVEKRAALWENQSWSQPKRRALLLLYHDGEYPYKI
jgi:hypothetical protein